MTDRTCGSVNGGKPCEWFRRTDCPREIPEDDEWLVSTELDACSPMLALVAAREEAAKLNCVCEFLSENDIQLRTVVHDRESQVKTISSARDDAMAEVERLKRCMEDTAMLGCDRDAELDRLRDEVERLANESARWKKAAERMVKYVHQCPEGCVCTENGSDECAEELIALALKEVP